MNKSKIAEALTSCSSITSNIIDNICTELKSKNIPYILQNKEIIVKDKTKQEIKSIISGVNGLDKKRLKLILQISESEGKIFIRQKFN